VVCGALRIRRAATGGTIGDEVFAVLESEIDLGLLDAAVDAAIDRGGPSGLRVLGFGEITLVLGWPPDRPRLAVKRLPVFHDSAGVEAYATLVEDYVAALRARGVAVVDTEVRRLAAPDGIHVYLVQPLVPRERVLSVLLASAPPARAERLLEQLADAVHAAVDAGLGLDAQAGNWAVDDDDGLALFDVSTPLMRTPEGRDRLDMSLFVSIYPPVLQPLLRRVAHEIASPYHDPRAVLLDVASNLHKEGLDRCVPMFLAAAAARVGPPIAHAEVARYFRRDRALWLTLQRLRRADRGWQRRVRRRPYPFLLAPAYRYGPMTPPGEDPS
jgi:hypothetical protein